MWTALAVAPLFGQDSLRQAPRVFIEAFVAHDSLSLTIASETRARLMPSTQMRVISSEDIRVAMESGEPDDFGQPWTIEDVRAVGRLYRADVIIDLSAERSSSATTIRAFRIRPVPRGVIEPLRIVSAPTVERAVSILCEEIGADSATVSPP